MRAVVGPAPRAAGSAARTRNQRVLLACLGLLTLAALGAGVGMGATRVTWRDILSALGGGQGVPDLSRDIVLKLRLPRVILAGLTGGSLGVAGALFQALFRNPLADPYLIGASSGASLGAVLAIALSVEFHLFGLGAVPLLAFLGATGTVLLVYALAREHGQLSVLTLVLAGVAVSSFLSALVSLLTYLTAEERLHQIVFWLMGGFSGATWLGVRLALPYFLLGTLGALAFARDLNAFLLGEETAHQLGVEVEQTKRWVLALASLLTGVAVACGGLIGFVGLVVPHVVRILGGPDHHFLIPAAALAGATSTMVADAVARSVLAPAELPVGLVTALAGAPFFIYVLRRRRHLRFFAQGN